MITGYSFRFALEGLKKEFWINLIASLSGATGLFIISIILLVFYNIHSATKRLPERFTVVLYLKDNLSTETIDTTIQALKNNQAVRSVRYIPKETALLELKKRLKDSSFLVEGLDENPLPDSIELRIKPEFVSPDKIKVLISELRAMNTIDEIDYGEDVIASIGIIKKAVERSGIGLSSVILIGVIFNFYTTIKILFYRRREEVETFKLLGASPGFIRAPFLIEGAIIGFSGGLIASGLAALLYQAFLFISTRFPIIGAFGLQPLEIWFLMGLPFGGALLGMIGALLAIGRIRY